MSNTLTVRLPKPLADWLEQTARRTGRSRGEIVREHLEKAKSADADPSFMRLGGAVAGPRDLSARKGFSRS